MAYENRWNLSMKAPALIERAQQVVSGISRGCKDETGFGGFSMSLYDTAWVSMVAKSDTTESRQWLFPEAFAYLLRHQHNDGSWGTNVSPVDLILNTMAGLLAVLEHCPLNAASFPKDDAMGLSDHGSRVSRATKALSNALCSWDVESTLHVGFEILVPCLLSQLAQKGVNLEFPGKERLMKLHQHKLSKFRPEMVTSEHQTTFLHSLEGLIDKVNFANLRHHCTSYGGMLGSPASTAAYLIYSSTWDENAEVYLRNVIQKCGSHGAVPSAFPTPIFVTSWTISTLLASGYSMDELSDHGIKDIAAYLEQLLTEQHGLVGFAPKFVPDADDTARSLLAMSYLGIQIDPTFLVEYFEAPDHFQTYKLERNPSFSANANTLLTLLKAPNVAAYVPQIEKTTRFLLSCWKKGGARDKWNLAPEYSQMLLANSLLELLAASSAGYLVGLATEIVTFEVPIVLCQLLAKTVSRQADNGSWANSVEQTAYSILLLAYILKLPWPMSLRETAQASLDMGRSYLAIHANEWSEGAYIWIEKVTYRLPTLSEAYSLAAMKISTEEVSWSSKLKDMFILMGKKIGHMSKFFEQLPMFQKTSHGVMTSAVAEAHFYSLKLRESRLEIFPRDNMGMTKDNYLDFIPITWTSVNALFDFPLSGETMWDMMVISMLNYQADEYMESVVGRLPEDSLIQMQYELQVACRDGILSRLQTSAGCVKERPLDGQLRTPPEENNSCQTPQPSLLKPMEVIKKYIQHVRSHRRVTVCPPAAQREVAEEMNQFLRAHMAHNADNTRLQKMDVHRDGLLNQSYFHWVRTTGANDTSCPYSFVFFLCLISDEGRPYFTSAKQKYFARALALHLATMCRQFNDYGSHSRDQQEHNLNSLDFADFHEGFGNGSEDKKHILMQIADFERKCMEICCEHLAKEISATTLAQIRVFIGVTDLFGQIYVARDIASRLESQV
ncbi:Ent-kaurene synthase [Penicillium longicatenatum]|uniref:Ent-kaurene synthase n=1 Tax=Penicillium longicatenatum TaxID=1561947 RepID=UPI002547F195|nr:Ent-kaurene synthase [Penicillium longicatenatum]KAJ5636931.1 Ent-kaurene synthase [Penicillium longicatenatum]